jgi:hypothetical protein
VLPAHQLTLFVVILLQVWDALQNNLLYVWKLPRSEGPSPHHADFVSSLCFNLAADGSVQLCAGCSSGVIQVGAGHAALSAHPRCMAVLLPQDSLQPLLPPLHAGHALYCSLLLQAGEFRYFCKFCKSCAEMCSCHGMPVPCRQAGGQPQCWHDVSGPPPVCATAAARSCMPFQCNIVQL